MLIYYLLLIISLFRSDGWTDVVWVNAVGEHPVRDDQRSRELHLSIVSRLGGIRRAQILRTLFRLRNVARLWWYPVAGSFHFVQLKLKSLIYYLIMQ